MEVSFFLLLELYVSFLVNALSLLPSPNSLSVEWNMTLRSKEMEKEDTQQRIQAMQKYSEWRKMTLHRGTRLVVSPPPTQISLTTYHRS